MEKRRGITELKEATPNPNILSCYTTQYAGSGKPEVTDLTPPFSCFFNVALICLFYFEKKLHVWTCIFFTNVMVYIY